MSLALELFHRLCTVGNGLEYIRDQAVPGMQTWHFLTVLLEQLDSAIDALVHSQGLGGADDASLPTPGTAREEEAGSRQQGVREEGGTPTPRPLLPHSLPPFPIPGTAGWYTAHPPPTGTLPDAFYAALEDFADAEDEEEGREA